MTTKPTPGPWVADASLDDYCRLHLRDGKGNSVTTVSAVRSGTHETIANANLIETSPHILKTLKTIEIDIGLMPSSTRGLIQDAIAKAEGRDSDG